MKTQKKISPLRISPYFCPKLGEDQNKKKVFTQILSVSELKLSAQVTKGGGGGMPQFWIFFYANYTILATQGEGHGTMTPPKFADGNTSKMWVLCYFCLL